LDKNQIFFIGGKYMKKKIPVQMYLVFLATLMISFLLNPLPSSTAKAADKTQTKTGIPGPATQTQEFLAKITPTRTPTEPVRKYKLFPGKYVGKVHIVVLSDLFQQISEPDWDRTLYQWTLEGTLSITITNARNAKASLAFNQIDGFALHEFYLTDIGGDGHLICHYTGMAEGHLSALSKSVVFNPESGGFTVPFETFLVNTNLIFDSGEGSICEKDNGQVPEALKSSSVVLSDINFTFNTDDSNSIGVGDNANCAMQSFAYSRPYDSNSCHWQVFKLAAQPKYRWKQ
jgi:hypothetical protein